MSIGMKIYYKWVKQTMGASWWGALGRIRPHLGSMLVSKRQKKNLNFKFVGLTTNLQKIQETEQMTGNKENMDHFAWQMTCFLQQISDKKKQ